MRSGRAALARVAVSVGIAAALAQGGCARLACEWEWRAFAAERMEPLRGADRTTRRELDAGRAAFKQDFLEACLGT